jgi:hypothetical protein
MAESKLNGLGIKLRVGCIDPKLRLVLSYMFTSL